jgi:hypothetical protein
MGRAVVRRMNLFAKLTLRITPLIVNQLLRVLGLVLPILVPRILVPLILVLLILVLLILVLHLRLVLRILQQFISLSLISPTQYLFPYDRTPCRNLTITTATNGNDATQQFEKSRRNSMERSLKS